MNHILCISGVWSLISSSSNNKIYYNKSLLNSYYVQYHTIGIVVDINDRNNSYPRGVYSLVGLTSNNYTGGNKPITIPCHMAELCWTWFRWKIGATIIMGWDLGQLGRRVSLFYFAHGRYVNCGGQWRTVVDSPQRWPPSFPLLPAHAPHIK